MFEKGDQMGDNEVIEEVEGEEEDYEDDEKWNQEYSK